MNLWSLILSEKKYWKKKYVFIYIKFPVNANYSKQQSVSPFPQSLVTSILLCICLFCTIYKWNHKSFCVPLPPLGHDVFSVQFIHVVTCIRFASFMWLIFHCMYIQYFVYSFIHWWTLVLFLSFGYFGNAAVNISVPVSWSLYFHFFLVFRNGIADHMIILYLTFWRMLNFFTTSTQFYILKQCMRVPISPHPQYFMFWL